MRLMRYFVPVLALGLFLAGCGGGKKNSEVKMKEGNSLTYYVNDYHNRNQVAAWDLDHDGSIDEAVRIHGVYSEFPGVSPIRFGLEKGQNNKFQHLVFPGYEKIATFSTSKTRPMTQSQRDSLNATYRFLVNK